MIAIMAGCVRRYDYLGGKSFRTPVPLRGPIDVEFTA